MTHRAARPDNLRVLREERHVSVRVPGTGELPLRPETDSCPWSDRWIPVDLPARNGRICISSGVENLSEPIGIYMGPTKRSNLKLEGSREIC